MSAADYSESNRVWAEQRSSASRIRIMLLAMSDMIVRLEITRHATSACMAEPNPMELGAIHEGLTGLGGRWLSANLIHNSLRIGKTQTFRLICSEQELAMEAIRTF